MELIAMIALPNVLIATMIGLMLCLFVGTRHTDKDTRRLQEKNLRARGREDRLLHSD
jgi:hypothetical protein